MFPQNPVVPTPGLKHFSKSLVSVYTLFQEVSEGYTPSKQGRKPENWQAQDKGNSEYYVREDEGQVPSVQYSTAQVQWSCGHQSDVEQGWKDPSRGPSE